MKGILIAMTAALVAGSAAASATSIEGSRDIEIYHKAAGGEVLQMPATALVDWQALDAQTLAVWTASNQPWMVRVAEPCTGLKNTDSVAMTSSEGNVVVGTDAVEVGGNKCRIASIQPVAYDKVASLRGERRNDMHEKASKAKASSSD